MLEYGLQCPNGGIFWGSWRGHDFSSPDGRANMRVALSKTAVELEWPEPDFTSRYLWVTREVSDHSEGVPVTSALVAPLPGEEPAAA